MTGKPGLHIQRRRHGWPNVNADAVPALTKTLEWGIVDEWAPQEQSELARIKRAE